LKVLGAEGDVSAFSCDATGRYAILGDSVGVTMLVSPHTDDGPNGSMAFLVMCYVFFYAFQDLEQLYQKPRVFYHQTKWKVHRYDSQACAQGRPIADATSLQVDCIKWNPHIAYREYVASTSDQHVLIWNVANDYTPISASLRKHTR
jgi:hypothetical protein